MIIYIIQHIFLYLCMYIIYTHTPSHTCVSLSVYRMTKINRPLGTDYISELSVHYKNTQFLYIRFYNSSRKKHTVLIIM